MTNPEYKHDEKHIDYVRDSKLALREKTSKVAIYVIYLLLMVIAFGFVWAYFAELDVVTAGEGKVIASSELQVIQHLEGGIVKEIKVKEGDRVKKGDVLVVLDNTRFNSEYKEILTKLAVYDAEIVRFQAESTGADKLEFDEKFKKQYPHLVAQEEQYFQSNRRALLGMIKILETSEELMIKELNIIRPLVRQGVMSNIDEIRLERQLNELKGQILDKKEKSKTDAGAQLNKMKSEKSVLLESLSATKDRMERSVVRSPVNGIIQQTYVSTIGEVVIAGKKIAEIVPLGDKLTVQAYIKPKDIGFIYPGQKAIVKVSAFDFSIYGGLDAKVKTISADAIVDQSGRSFYEVKLEVEKEDLGKNGTKLEIIPGMTVTVNIITGKKTVLEYILKPIFKAKYTALRER